MSLIKVVDVDSIVEINENFTGTKCNIDRRKKVSGCFSSYYYYDSPEMQITSIVVSLVKGHFFVDGNKRTALMVYLILCNDNGLKYITDKKTQLCVFERIASNHKPIEYYVNLLFSKN